MKSNLLLKITIVLLILNIFANGCNIRIKFKEDKKKTKMRCETHEPQESQRRFRTQG